MGRVPTLVPVFWSCARHCCRCYAMTVNKADVPELMVVTSRVGEGR